MLIVCILIFLRVFDHSNLNGSPDFDSMYCLLLIVLIGRINFIVYQYFVIVYIISCCIYTLLLNVNEHLEEGVGRQ